MSAGKTTFHPDLRPGSHAFNLQPLTVSPLWQWRMSALPMTFIWLDVRPDRSGCRSRRYRTVARSLGVVNWPQRRLSKSTLPDDTAPGSGRQRAPKDVPNASFTIAHCRPRQYSSTMRFYGAVAHADEPRLRLPASMPD